MIKAAIVVQRYGKDVVGGAETLARDVAERLSAGGSEVTVFTTTAKDYITWKPHYKEGESILKGVAIQRYDVEFERDIESFNHHSQEFFAAKPDERDEDDWIVKQGPYCPRLIDAMASQQDNFDVFLFFTYLYYTTVEGQKVVDKPIILFPTAHDELPIHMNLMKPVFSRPDALLFLTGAEMEMVKRFFNPPNITELARTGLDIHSTIDEGLFRKNYLEFLPYILYAGRIERGKGLEIAFNAYRELRKERLLDFVLVGKKLMDIPEIEGLRYLGYVSEEEKLSAFKGAVCSVQPSPLESLSITTLESFSQYTPVLVNQQSDVLMEHVDISGGGLEYGNEGDFMRQCKTIYDNRKLRREMGIKGYHYVKDYFSWDVVTEKIQTVMRQLTGG